MRRADADQAPSRTSQVALADAAGHGGEVEGGDRGDCGEAAIFAG